MEKSMTFADWRWPSAAASCSFSWIKKITKCEWSTPPGLRKVVSYKEIHENCPFKPFEKKPVVSCEFPTHRALKKNWAVRFHTNSRDSILAFGDRPAFFSAPVASDKIHPWVLHPLLQCHPCHRPHVWCANVFYKLRCWKKRSKTYTWKRLRSFHMHSFV